MMHVWNGGLGAGPYGFGFPWGGLAMNAVVVALAIFAIIAFIRSGRNGKDSGDPRERGLEILVERYARGEIDAETFKAMKIELDSKN